MTATLPAAPAPPVDDVGDPLSDALWLVLCSHGNLPAAQQAAALDRARRRGWLPSHLAGLTAPADRWVHATLAAAGVIADAAAAGHYHQPCLLGPTLELLERLRALHHRWLPPGVPPHELAVHEWCRDVVDTVDHLLDEAVAETTVVDADVWTAVRLGPRACEPLLHTMAAHRQMVRTRHPDGGGLRLVGVLPGDHTDPARWPAHWVIEEPWNVQLAVITVAFSHTHASLADRLARHGTAWPDAVAAASRV